MTLGGLAVALGELVDDAIVDVENIFRQLKRNRASPQPRPVLSVIFDASVEVRNAIIISTVLVVIVFAPLFALTGMEGRLFAPLGVATHHPGHQTVGPIRYKVQVHLSGACATC